MIENWERRGLGAENENSVNAGARGELANADSVSCGVLLSPVRNIVRPSQTYLPGVFR